MCFIGTDEPAKDVTKPPAAPPCPSPEQEEKLADLVPGLKGATYRSYFCHKLKYGDEKTGRLPLFIDHRESDASLAGLYSQYPGKFTTARAAAKKSVRRILGIPDAPEVHVEREAHMR